MTEQFPVLVRFHRGAGLGAALVRFWTRSAYGHVDLVAAGLVLDVRPSTGIRWVPLNQAPTTKDMHVVTLTLTNKQINDGHLAVAPWVGHRYDWWGAIAAGLPWLAREHKDRGFCSEMVSEWLNGAAAIFLSGETWREQPISVLNLLRPKPAKAA